MGRRFGAIVAFVAGGLVGASCGTPQGATCQFVDACGGDPVGAWTFISGCVGETNQGIVDCGEASSSLTDLTTTGAVTFNGDGTYQLSLRQVGHESVELPPSCIFPSEHLTCTQLADAERTTFSPNWFSSIACSGTDVCHCALTIMSSQDEVGTWSTTGTTLATQPSTGAPDAHSYCVQGGELRLLRYNGVLADGASSIDPAVRIAADLVARRQ